MCIRDSTQFCITLSGSSVSDEGALGIIEALFCQLNLSQIRMNIDYCPGITNKTGKRMADLLQAHKDVTDFVFNVFNTEISSEVKASLKQIRNTRRFRYFFVDS
eukprot:TRINITY_DN18929_c0_g1_i1.p1 TRINITY_DN18929_c0_g1~~TRINITY_DN18929_c0_g1_i1.p1  ORF type:complete len:116 (+),score=21.28 TRINITY_DN18929_c0_g1_i1:38-349(+)